MDLRNDRKSRRCTKESMLSRALPVMALLTLGSVEVLPAQRLETRLVRWEPPQSALPTAWRMNQADTGLVRSRDYRYEGLAFGGIVFGAAGAWIGWNVSVACPTVPGASCEPDRLGNAAAAGLMGAALGGGLGYLIGRLSSKPGSPRLPVVQPVPPSSITAPARRRVGYQHWKGAAIGSGSGALLGMLLSVAAAGSCADCEGGGGSIVKVGALGAGLGGAFGFLAGLATPKYDSD
jgi:hypothetical protein